MRKREGAFTLIEILIATSILAFLMVSIYSIFYESSLVWEKGNARTQMYQNARVCLDTMAREIRGAFISSANPRLTFRGEVNSLNYVSASNKANKAGEYDLCKVEYSLNDSNLYRRVKSTLYSAPEKSGASSTLALHILSLNYSYYDGSKWRQSWDSTMGTPDDASDDDLPLAVKITIITRDERKQEVPLTLSTIAYISQRGYER